VARRAGCCEPTFPCSDSGATRVNSKRPPTLIFPPPPPRRKLLPNPFGAVTPVGKPKAGKKQLRIEEARLFIETALKRYEKKRKPVLLAAVMALTMGLRASEILKRQVRDLDDGCGILWIDQGKTHNARRHLRIPEFLRLLLQELIKGKGPESFLFPSELPGQSVRRQRLWAVVQDICKQAGVTRVCAHSLRGLYATLAVESGALSETVAASLGHGSFSMTEKHYAQQSSVSNVKTARVESMLSSQRSMDGSPADVTLHHFNGHPKPSSHALRYEGCSCKN